MPRLSFDWVGEALSRRVLLYAAFTVVVFAVCLIENFPHEVVVRRFLSQIELDPLRVDFSSARFAWHRGYELRGVRLTKAGTRNGHLPLLEMTTLDVRPELLRLIRGQLDQLLWDGQLYGGRAVGIWRVTGGGGSGTVELDRLDLGRYQTLAALLDEGQISGQLSGNFAVAIGGGDGGGPEIDGELDVLRPALTGAKIAGFTIPDLQFGQVKGKLGVKGRRCEIQELRATGDQLNVQLSGSILARVPVGDSQLNLRVVLEESPATPDAIKALLALIPRGRNARPGSPITISGTLAAPRTR